MIFSIIIEIVSICFIVILLIVGIKSFLKEIKSVFQAQIYLFKAVLSENNKSKEVFIVFKTNIKKLNEIKKIKKKQKKHRAMWNKEKEKDYK